MHPKFKFILLVVLYLTSFSTFTEARYLATGGCMAGYTTNPVTGNCEGPVIYDTVCDADGYCWTENPHCAAGSTLKTNVTAVSVTSIPVGGTASFYLVNPYNTGGFSYATVHDNNQLDGQLIDLNTTQVINGKTYNVFSFKLQASWLGLDRAPASGTLSRYFDMYIDNKNFSSISINILPVKRPLTNPTAPIIGTYQTSFTPDGIRHKAYTYFTSPPADFYFTFNVTANYNLCEQTVGGALTCPSGGSLSGAWCICTNQAIPAFTDSTITPGATKIRATHINELRTQINNKRDDALLTAFGWTDSTITPGTTKIRATHISELRTAIQQVYQACGQVLPVFTDPTITPGSTKIRATHINELRNATTLAP